MKRTILCAAVLALLLLGGCATSSTSAGGKGVVCKSLATVNSGLTSLSNAGNNVSVRTVKSLQAGMSTALTAVSKVAPSSVSAPLNQLTAANAQLGQTLANLPDSDTLGQHGPQLQQFKSQVAQAQSAETQVASKLGCSA